MTKSGIAKASRKAKVVGDIELTSKLGQQFSTLPSYSNKVKIKMDDNGVKYQAKWRSHYLGEE